MNAITKTAAASAARIRKGATKAREVPFAAQNFSKIPDDARIDVKSVAAVLGIGVSTAWSWVARGIIPPPTRLGRTTRWRAGTIRDIATGGQ